MLATIRGWSFDGADLSHGQIRGAAYDGQRRLAEFREGYVNDPAVISDAYGEMARAQLPDWQTPGDFEGASAGLDVPYGTFERTKLGTLLEERRSGEVEYYADTFSGRGVALAGGRLVGEVELGWDAERGLLTDVADLSLTWSDDGRLLRAESADGIEEYRYDGYGRLIRISRDGHTLDRVWAGEEVVLEVTACGERAWWQRGALDEAAAFSVWWTPQCDPGALGAEAYDAQLALLDLEAVDGAMQTDAGAHRALMTDLRGDVTGVLGRDGELLETYSYDLHGVRTIRDRNGHVVCEPNIERTCASRIGNPRGYSGRPHSPVTGLVDLRHRWYSPLLRIFTAPDPLGAIDSHDLWLYVAGDPLNFIDPFGLMKMLDGQVCAHFGAFCEPEQFYGANATSNASSGLLGAPLDRAGDATIRFVDGMITDQIRLGEAAGLAAARAKLAADGGRYLDAAAHGGMAVGAVATFFAMAASNVAGGGGARGATSAGGRQAVAASASDDAAQIAKGAGRGGSGSGGPGGGSTGEVPTTLFHYTDDAGLKGIADTKKIIPSKGPVRARHGNGQYFTDVAPERIVRTKAEVVPGSNQMSLGQISRLLYGIPWNTNKFRNFLEVSVAELPVRKAGPNNFVLESDQALNVSGRIVRSGRTLP